MIPLEGIRVLDASQGIAGPHVGMLLARYGAEVIKIEPPSGDWGRTAGPTQNGQSAISAVYNLGKKSLALDLKKPEAVALVLDMAATADVMIESSRPGVAARIGIGPEAVRARNPRLVYLSVSGFGQDGPLVAQPCTDTVAQAFSGLMSNNQGTDGVPRKLDIPIIDVLTGLYGFHTVAMALMERAATGQGRYAAVSLTGCIAEVQAARMIDYHLAGGPPKVLNAPAGAFRAADGYVALTALSDTHFRRIAAALGADHLAEDPKYATAPARVDNAAELKGIIEGILATATVDEWVGRLAAHDVLGNRVNDLGDWMTEPHVKATGGVALHDQPGLGQIPRPAAQGAPGNVPPASPGIGEHTGQILREFGLDDAAIADLRDAGALG